MSAPVPDPEIYLGRLTKAFGIKGEIKFVASDDFWMDVLKSEQLVMQQLRDGELHRRPVHITHFRPHSSHFVVRIEGIEDRNGAEDIGGSELFVDVTDLDVELPDSELPFQVVGRKVRLEDGRELGTVTSVIFSAAHPVYEVTGKDGVTLIPAIPQFVVENDEAEGVITIRPMPGLIDE